MVIVIAIFLVFMMVTMIMMVMMSTEYLSASSMLEISHHPVQISLAIKWRQQMNIFLFANLYNHHPYVPRTSPSLLEFGMIDSTLQVASQCILLHESFKKTSQAGRRLSFWCGGNWRP